MKVLLLGHGIAYSASPAMHNAAFAAAGLDGWTYELLDIPRHLLPNAVARLRADDHAGANVTIPHKRDVIPLLDELDEEADALGAVNTIVRRGQSLVGTNTDVHGIRAALAQANVDPSQAKAVILGAGGSARAALRALAQADVTLLARQPERVARPGTATVLNWFDPRCRDVIHDADVLINATPLGRHGELPIDPHALNPDGALIDLVYVPGGTPLIHKGSAKGMRTVDGWPILLAQGAASFKSWTGVDAPITAMREALDKLAA